MMYVIDIKFWAPNVFINDWLEIDVEINITKDNEQILF